MAPHLYDTLLYLCADGDRWEEHVAALNPQPSADETLAPLPILSAPAPSTDDIDSSSPAALAPATASPAKFERSASPVAAELQGHEITSSGAAVSPDDAVKDKQDAPKEVKASVSPGHMLCG